MSDPTPNLYQEALRQIESLKLEIDTLKKSSTYTNLGNTIQGHDLMLIRINHRNEIEYINEVFCEYFQTNKEDLVGKKKQILDSLPNQVLLEPLRESFTEGSKILEISDSHSQVFKVKLTVGPKTLDGVFENITEKHRFKTYVHQYIGTDLTTLSSEDLSSFYYPERRRMSVSFTNLRGFTYLSENLPPDTVRQTLSTYFKATIHAIEQNQGTIDKLMGDEVMALFGAPRFFRNHALKALTTAFDQLDRIQLARKELKLLGMELPGIGIGINCGEMILGSIGSESRRDYTVLGSSVSIGSKLANIARENEILVTEEVLNEIFQNLPPRWEIRKNQTDWSTPHLKENWRVITPLELPIKTKLEGGITRGIYPLTNNIGTSFSIGVANHPIYKFHYVYGLRVKGVRHIVPVILVSKMGEAKKELFPSETPTLYNGTRMLGKYQLVEMLGKGGMGEVWKGKDQFGNWVALKTLISPTEKNSKKAEQFRKEASIMSGLQHKNICRIFEVGEIDSIQYIAMEFIEGITLSKLLSPPLKGGEATTDALTLNFESALQEGAEQTRDLTPQIQNIGNPSLPFSIPEAVEIILKICKSVAYVHQHGVIHRDIKPQNIMIQNNHEPVLMDFGVARHRDDGLGRTKSKTKQVFGTLEYMAPEQAIPRKEDDHRVDVFGIGAVLYQMLTGQKQFKASKNLIYDIKRLQSHQPVPPQQLNPEIPQDLNDIILKALKVRPSERYSSVNELKKDLENFIQGKPVSAHAPSIWYTFKKHLIRLKIQYGLWILAGILLSLFIILLQRK